MDFLCAELQPPDTHDLQYGPHLGYICTPSPRLAQGYLGPSGLACHPWSRVTGGPCCYPEQLAGSFSVVAW